MEMAIINNVHPYARKHGGGAFDRVGPHMRTLLQ